MISIGSPKAESKFEDSPAGAQAFLDESWNDNAAKVVKFLVKSGAARWISDPSYDRVWGLHVDDKSKVIVYLNDCDGHGDSEEDGEWLDLMVDQWMGEF